MRSSRPKARVALPSNSSEPGAGRSRSRKSLASVVLPDPDSPTMPRVSASATCTLTPSSALIHLLTVNPPVTGKYFVRPSACKITEGSPWRHVATGDAAQQDAVCTFSTVNVGGDTCSQIVWHSGLRGGDGQGGGVRTRGRGCAK